jgi:HlyD family secretion protein
MLEIALPGKLQTTCKRELPYLSKMQKRADVITDDISLLQRLVLLVRKIVKESM